MIPLIPLAMIGLLAWPLPAALAAPDHSAAQPCPLDPQFVTPDETLAAFAAAVKAGGTVEILALGSASTVAPGGYPVAMMRALRAALPDTQFALTVRGGRGLTAPALRDRLTEALQERRYPLVLWQTGTVDAVRALHPDALLDALEQGAAAVTAQGGNLVLIDPQFSHFLRANTDIDEYEQVMLAAAALPGVTLFRRFDLMHDWAESGWLDPEHTAKSEAPSVAARLHACLGAALAQYVLNGIRK